MAEQRMKVRDKKVQKMTKDGLVEENLTDKSSVRVSNRASDVQMGRKQGEKEENLVDKSPRQSKRSGKNIRPSVQKSRDAPELMRTENQSEDFGQNRKQQNRKRIRAEVGKESRLAEKSEASQSGRLKEKRANLSENRGDSRSKKNGGSKKPKQKQRLKFAYEETGASMKSDKDMEKLNQMDTDGVNFRHQKQKEKAKKFSYEEPRKKKEAKQHSKKAQVYRANKGETPGKKKSRLKFGEGESVKTEKAFVVKKAGSATSAALHREISKNEDDNAAVEGAHKLEEGCEGIYRLEQRSARQRKQRASRKRSRLERQAEKQTQAAARQEQKKLKKQIQKQQIKRDYAKAKRSEQTVGTATKGTIDYIKKIGGKVTNFFKENRKVYISVAVLIGLMFLIITNVTSCSAVFLQNVITYTGTSYLSSDQAIREAELYYTQLEANLQERINNMESEEPGHEEYRYNIGPIEHDPFILISYLSAKYEEFTFEQVKPELDALFALQYQLETEAVNETVTETATVRVGESLGQVVTSGYCNCPICCGQWSGGPTASGAYPQANHTIAVDASNPFVPIGTKVVMNGVEYTVEDTGAFARYGVQFDVYYDNHAAASAHGHQTWEAYIADDNGSQEVTVTSTSTKKILYVTLTNGSFDAVARANLNAEQLIIYNALNTTYGNRNYLWDVNNVTSGSGGNGMSYEIPPEALQDEEFARMIREAEKYLGVPYVWGGYSPSGFDCSGFVSYVINHCGNGWNYGRLTADGLRGVCTYVSPQEAKPGDLIFFQGTYNTSGASHVGIYVGNNMMIHCGDPIHYSNISTSYWQQHFMCFGRLP